MGSLSKLFLKGVLILLFILQAPYFLNLAATTTTVSNEPVGTVMYTVSATDDDIFEGDVVFMTLDSIGDS
jgi:hypothetical protein